MTEAALKAFIHEYRIDFSIGIDTPSGDPNDPIPKTMRNYQMRGTPTLLLFDRQGQLRKHKMGHEQDLVLGAELMRLIREDAEVGILGQSSENPATVCAPEGCE